MAFSSGEHEMALPAEWTDKVCSYLEVEDLLNLSASNIFWRNAVNRNSIWKPLCIKYFNVHPTEKPIIDRKCRVEPAFKIVANSSPNLSDICSWRIRYAQEIHVINNWIQQRYHFEEPSAILWSTDGGFVLGNSLLFIYYEGTTRKYSIWDLNNDTIADSNQVGQFYSFRNGFLDCYEEIISYYALKEDVFELKIRTVFQKALHPEIPLMADNSSLKNYIKTHFFKISTRNDRYFILSNNFNSGTIIVWDFETLNTFSFDLSFFDSSAATANGDYRLWVGERESSILFLQVAPFLGNCTPLFILNIQNSTIVLLHHFDNLYPFGSFHARIVGDSLALLGDRGIHFLESNGSTRSTRRNADFWSNFKIDTLINCRSFYCGLRGHWSYGKCTFYEVFLIDKESFSVQVIKKYEGSESLVLEQYFQCCSLDFVFVKKGISERTELINLKKLKIIELDEDFDTAAFKSNKIIRHNCQTLYFW